MHKIRECTRFLAHHAGSPRRLRVVMLVGLAVLLMAGCQGEGTPDGSNQAAIDDSGKASDATGQKGRNGTAVDENYRTSDSRKQTLELLTRLIGNCDSTLSKLAGEQEAYASAGNEQGERLMAQAAENVRDIKGTASALKGDVQYSAAAGGSASASVASASAIAMQEEIEDSVEELEENLAEAERCCGLPPDFLDSNLQNLRTQAAGIEHHVDQIGSERPTPQPTAQPTAQPSAQPTAERTAEYTAQPTAQPTAPSAAQYTAQPTAEPTEQP
jgi:hypothetical protein